MYQLPVFYHQSRPLGGIRVLKTNYVINFNNFLAKKPILDPKMSSDRAGLNPQLFLEKESPNLLC